MSSCLSSPSFVLLMFMLGMIPFLFIYFINFFTAFTFSLCWFFSLFIMNFCLIFLNQIFLVSILKLFIYKIVHHKGGCVIWSFKYYFFQGILISFCLIFISIDVYNIFVYSLCIFLSLFYIYNIFTFLHHIWVCDLGVGG